MKWNKVSIDTHNGVQTGIAPVIISASRTTDIPAFHARWFMHRVRAGYCLWENPFNSKQQQYVSFEQCKAFVFWTKNAQKLMPYLTELDDSEFQYYFQYSINDYDAERLEPNLASVQQRLEVFQELSERIGKHRVLWRFDPIILSDFLRVEHILEKFERIAQGIAPYTEKCIFSFVDWYKKTETNLKKIDGSYGAPNQEEMHAIAHGITQINKNLTQPLKLATCAETIALEHMGVEHNTCIDPELLLRLCPHDEAVHKLCGKSTKSTQLSLIPLKKTQIKDSGQRTPCGCAPSKDIGSYNSCMHFCAYCYANQSEQSVRNKMRLQDINSEKL